MGEAVEEKLVDLVEPEAALEGAPPAPGEAPGPGGPPAPEGVPPLTGEQDWKTLYEAERRRAEAAEKQYNEWRPTADRARSHLHTMAGERGLVVDDDGNLRVQNPERYAAWLAAQQPQTPAAAAETAPEDEFDYLTDPKALEARIARETQQRVEPFYQKTVQEKTIHYIEKLKAELSPEEAQAVGQSMVAQCQGMSNEQLAMTDAMDRAYWIAVGPLLERRATAATQAQQPTFPNNPNLQAVQGGQPFNFPRVVQQARQAVAQPSSPAVSGNVPRGDEPLTLKGPLVDMIRLQKMAAAFNKTPEQMQERLNEEERLKRRTY